MLMYDVVVTVKMMIVLQSDENEVLHDYFNSVMYDAAY